MQQWFLDEFIPLQTCASELLETWSSNAKVDGEKADAGELDTARAAIDEATKNADSKFKKSAEKFKQIKLMVK